MFPFFFCSAKRNHKHKEASKMKTCFQSRTLFYVIKIGPW